MFDGASSFNQTLAGWNVGNLRVGPQAMLTGTCPTRHAAGAGPCLGCRCAVQDIHSMFSGATSFDQNLAGWNLRSLENADAVFDVRCSNPDTAAAEHSKRIPKYLATKCF